MRKKEIKSPFKTKQIVLACVFIVLVLAFYVYWLFVKPISPDPGVASIRVADAAQNPNSPQVQKILATNHAVRFDLPGCSNLHKVSGSLYRGAQPTKEGFESLKKLGIKTVVNLRDHHSDEELLAGTGLDYKPIPMDTWDVTPDNVTAFLRIVADPNAAPVFVHCQHGADRTGTMVAAYRMAIQEWNKERAIREMTHGGFGYHPLWTELPALLRKLDIEAIKKQIPNQSPVALPEKTVP
ncbi:MAG: dual specificity protein phosphatase family protein [Anaerohalosphaeraceae bacterium]